MTYCDLNLMSRHYLNAYLTKHKATNMSGYNQLKNRSTRPHQTPQNPDN